MVTTRQIALGAVRTMRAMEREAQRAQRQQLAYQKAVAKQEMLNAASDAAQSYERLISVLTLGHRVSFQRFDWASIAGAEEPNDPLRSDVRELAAKTALARYKPGWLARTFGVAERRRKKLAAAVTHARWEDDQAYEQSLADAAGRREEIAYARAVLAGDRQAQKRALDEHADFSDLGIEGLQVLFSDDRVIAVVDGVEIDDVPTQSVALLQSGKASVKPLPASKIQELHRDSICSSGVRVATEFLRALPIDSVEVVVQSDLLDRGSGHIEPHPVFYARIAAQALDAVNLMLADATPLAERLGAHFEWNRKEGFLPLDLAPFKVPLDAPVSA